MFKQNFVSPVTETQTVQVEASGPDGQKVKVGTPVVNVRYVAALQEGMFPYSYDVYRLDGTKLPEEEGRKLLKDEHAVVVVSGAAQMAEVMSPLGRKLYRDDVLIIVIKNGAPPLVSVPGDSLPAARPLTAPPVYTPATPKLLAPPADNPAPNFRPSNEIPFKGDSFDPGNQ